MCCSTLKWLLPLAVFLFLGPSLSAQQGDVNLKSHSSSLLMATSPSNVQVIELADGRIRTQVTNPDGSVSYSVSRPHPGGQPVTAITEHQRITSLLEAIETKWEYVFADSEQHAQALEVGWYSQMETIKQELLDALEALTGEGGEP
jgi:hypothetical protein